MFPLRRRTKWEKKQLETNSNIMELISKKGDIFNGDEYYKVHQVNCKGAMGAGIAKTIREKYPKVYDSYKKVCDKQEKSSDLLGKVQVVNTGQDFCVVNLFGQDGYHASSGRCTNYEAFYTGLEKLREYIYRQPSGRKEVAFPCRIASALAGGDWNVILAMIKSVFEPTDIKVVIYDFNG